MTFDWQTIPVFLIVAAALVFVARRFLNKMRAFYGAAEKSDCSTGCGKCAPANARRTNNNVPPQAS